MRRKICVFVGSCCVFLTEIGHSTSGAKQTSTYIIINKDAHCIKKLISQPEMRIKAAGCIQSFPHTGSRVWDL
jgi:hypothetical protein